MVAAARLDGHEPGDPESLRAPSQRAVTPDEDCDRVDDDCDGAIDDDFAATPTMCGRGDCVNEADPILS